MGTDHEKKCAVARLRTPEQVNLMSEVVDAIHDLLEGKVSDDAIHPILVRGMVDGGSGV